MIGQEPEVKIGSNANLDWKHKKKYHLNRTDGLKDLLFTSNYFYSAQN